MTVNRTDYHDNRRRWSDLRLTFVHELRNRGRQGRLFLSLFSKVDNKGR